MLENHGYFFFITSILFNDSPVPIATQSSGSLAIKTGTLVASAITSGKCFNNAPPPVRTIPWSITSAAISGDVSSNVPLIAVIILSTTSCKAVDTSFADTCIVFGKPVTRSRPVPGLFPFLLLPQLMQSQYPT